jgi:plasmid stabilization system protein ParE
VKPITVHDQAQVEIDEATAWYESERSGLGSEFLTEIERAVGRIRENPVRGVPYKATTFRFLLVRRFPYVIYYTELRDRIWIAAVAHAKRRPGYWRRRKPD